MRFKGKIDTFIGKETAFEGDLYFSGALRIDGKFKGRIHSGGTLTVGRQGKVDAEIIADQIIVAGRVNGTIMARDTIEVQVTGRVSGDIQAPRVIIAQGAFFEGRCLTAAIPKDPVPLKLSLLQDYGSDGDKWSKGSTDNGS